jgi:hypothetical protein
MNNRQRIEKFIFDKNLATPLVLRQMAENRTHDEYIDILIKLSGYDEPLDCESCEPDTTIMGSYDTHTTMDEQIKYLQDEIIRRGHETQQTLSRFKSEQKNKRVYRNLMEELARYFDKQVALGLPIEKLEMKQSAYIGHVILL